MGEVRVEGLELGGFESGTVKIGGKEVEIDEDGRPVADEEK